MSDPDAEDATDISQHLSPEALNALATISCSNCGAQGLTAEVIGPRTLTPNGAPIGELTLYCPGCDTRRRPDQISGKETSAIGQINGAETSE